MNVLFLSIVHKSSIEEHGIYTDLLRQFRDNGHSVYMVSPYEKRMEKNTEYLHENGVNMLYVRIGNITKCGRIEKGISMITIERAYLQAIKKYFLNVKFDLILYPTPPITLVDVVKYIKKRDNAKTYLLLKDIFPQNAVDIGMMSKSGVKGIVYRYFRSKERKIYAVSDMIGCMSPANVQYVLKHNPEIPPNRVCVSPNCIEPRDFSLSLQERKAMREKYGIPQEEKVFVYGGNLGKPQGIPFLIECLRSQKLNADALFLIVGDGTEYIKLEEFIKKDNPKNVRLMQRLPKEDYDRMIAACDVGMIFLDHRFTIPNFPSRILAYMQAGLPVLACTDPNTDVGAVIEKNELGWWCESNDVTKFARMIQSIIQEDLSKYNHIIQTFLCENYNVQKVYQKMITSINSNI